ncbi:MAG TPA: hypothetical protein VK177_01815 [Flavobacteriales bacterium]|nr:hypothetical protein [Flavobacteriales bacterium]
MPENKVNAQLEALAEDAEKKSPIVEAHKVEKKIHNLEEIAFHMENRKVNDALSSKKNLARHMRSRGRR